MTDITAPLALSVAVLGVLYVMDGRRVNVGIALLIVAVLMMLANLLRVQLEILEMIK